MIKVQYYLKINNLICSSISIDGMFLFTFQNLGVKAGGGGGGGSPCTLIEQSRCDPYNELLCLSYGAYTCVYLQFIFHYNICVFAKSMKLMSV